VTRTEREKKEIEVVWSCDGCDYMVSQSGIGITVTLTGHEPLHFHAPSSSRDCWAYFLRNRHIRVRAAKDRLLPEDTFEPLAPHLGEPLGANPPRTVVPGPRTSVP